MSWAIAMNGTSTVSRDFGSRRDFHLTTAERKIISACAEVLLPAGGAIRKSGLEAGVVGRFEQIVGDVPVKTRLLLRALLALVEVSAPLAGVLGGRLSKLSLEKKRTVLQGLMNHRVYLLRTAFLGLRTMLTLCYFSDAQVNEQLGCVPDLDPFHMGDGAT